MSEAQTIAQLREENAILRQELAELRRLIFGSKSERFKGLPADQLSLFGNASPPESASPAKVETVTYGRSKKKHPGRHALPDHLPVEEVILEPMEDVSGLEKIGEEITETLDYTPALLIKRRTIRPKYVDRKTGQIHIASMPDRPLPKAIAEAGLLSHILISKYVDHLPLYRQARMFERDFGWSVAQSTLVDWVRAVGDLLTPLYEVLVQKVLSSTYIQADESPLKVLEYGKSKGKAPPSKKIMQGYQWVYYAPELELVYFNYRKGRGQHGPKEVLASYSGSVQCDGYQVYDKIAAVEPSITLLGCLAHARRYFEKALDSDPSRADHVLDQIRTVYRWERESKPAPIEERQKVRSEKILPILENIQTWAQKEYEKVLPKSPIGQAMYYYQAQWKKIKAAARDARFHLDNNRIENQIRPLALGRKNYLFAGSHEGAQRMAMMYSFLGTCKQKGINPRVWLKEILQKIPAHPVNRLEELLPGCSDENQIT